MKILLVADLHYTLRQWDWVQEVAGRFDLVVVAGDLLDIGSIVPLHAQSIVVGKYLGRIAGRAPLLVCSGNHDVMEDPDGVRRASWLTSLDAPSLVTDGAFHRQDGWFFSIVPWWEDDETRDEAEAMLDRHRGLLEGDRWAWIHHPPPSGSTTAWSGRDDGGDEVCGKWIDRFRPDFLFSGHIHYAPFHAGGSWIDRIGDTWVFNAGRQTGPVPTFIVVDTEPDLATWVAAGEAERARLVPPLARQPLVSA
ncbi:MAG: metallophosphoesterase family protein [Verrucomicrobiae bacterium]|nr:metallophosphoesterase family protein [Verrucomicrobiae bacterium]